ncbi:hypothetical protein DF186_24720, partial [Enterococcus hirae]
RLGRHGALGQGLDTALDQDLAVGQGHRLGAHAVGHHGGRHRDEARGLDVVELSGLQRAGRRGAARDQNELTVGRAEG